MTRLKQFATLMHLLLIGAMIAAGCSSSGEMSDYEAAQQARLENVKAQRFDNGRMWTFDHPPLEYFKEQYNFSPKQEWLDDVRMSSLRLATWCSASFVSADGLVMTNHHCSRSSLVKVQKEGENLLDTGFFAPTLADERRVPELYVEQLEEIRDVTQEIHDAMDAAQTDEARIEERDRVIKALEAEFESQPTLRGQVVTFYDGGKYSLYVYRRYEDVRLVFAPELQVAHFGGEYDNFTYPRYGLDYTFFRVYDDNGQPFKPEHFFNWSKGGAKEGELVFVVGNPGSTNRLSTTEQLEYFRDVHYPYVYELLNNRMETLVAYADMHPEKKEELRTDILSIANGQKAYMGRLAGLRDDVLMARRRDFNNQFRNAVMAKSELKEKYGRVWDEIAEARMRMRQVAPDLYSFRSGGLGVSEHFGRAMMLARFATELSKPEAERAAPYMPDRIEETRQRMNAFTRIDDDMDRLTLTHQLKLMRGMLGDEDPVLNAARMGKTCGEAADAMISASALNDSVLYRELVAGAPASIMASADPFVRMALQALPRYDAAAEVSRSISARDEVNRTLLGRALFEVYGTSIPPDATFTLRLADGVVKGYEYNGTRAPSHTTFFGMYDRNRSFPGEEAWELPERWRNPSSDFDMSTPLDFCSTNDIIGGNSGSPMINTKKEIVGLIFDGNIESLPGDFIFAEDMGNRTVSVHSSGILETLRNIFHADRVAEELERGALPYVED